MATIIARPGASSFDTLAERVQAEIMGDAPKIASALFPTTPPGMEKLPRSQFVDYVRGKWQNQGFRQSLLARMGPKNFVDLSHEVLGVGQQEAAQMADGGLASVGLSPVLKEG